MNYETSKKLKDAGWNGGGESWVCYHDNLIDDVHIDFMGEACRYNSDLKVDTSTDEFTFGITLSDIIEACHKEGRWLSLNGFGNEWEAASSRKEPHNLTLDEWKADRKSGKGQTPEESMVNLYLAINKK